MPLFSSWKRGDRMAPPKFRTWPCGAPVPASCRSSTCRAGCAQPGSPEPVRSPDEQSVQTHECRATRGEWIVRTERSDEEQHDEKQCCGEPCGDGMPCLHPFSHDARGNWAPPTLLCIQLPRVPIVFVAPRFRAALSDALIRRPTTLSSMKFLTNSTANLSQSTLSK